MRNRYYREQEVRSSRSPAAKAAASSLDKIIRRQQAQSAIQEVIPTLPEHIVDRMAEVAGIADDVIVACKEGRWAR